MIDWVNSHGIAMLIGYYIFAAVSGGMPTPGPNAGVAYRWVFSSLSLLNASVARFVATQLPNTSVGQKLTTGAANLTPPQP